MTPDPFHFWGLDAFYVTHSNSKGTGHGGNSIYASDSLKRLGSLRGVVRGQSGDLGVDTTALPNAGSLVVLFF